MNRKIVVLTLCAILFACASARAQQARKVVRIGYLDDSTSSRIAVRLETLRQELSKLGWIEGKNITVVSRFAEGKNDRLAALAADLVRLKVDLVVRSDASSVSG
jgi:putative ABC transport system substrate-binding protein